MKHKNDISIATYLAEHGRLFSEEIYERNRPFFNEIQSDYYPIAAAISLGWTLHSKFEFEFFEYASRFIDGSIAKDASMAKRFCKRFGPDELDEALIGYRSFYRRVKDLMPDFRTCSVHDINKLQQRLLSKLNKYREEKAVNGIGPFLFLGPFKIILEDQKRLWEVDGIDSIVLATGFEVNKGILRLKKEGYKFMEDFDPDWLNEHSGSLLDNYATCSMVHTHIVKVSESAKVPALFVNSALYKYGRKDI